MARGGVLLGAIPLPAQVGFLTPDA